MPSRPSPTPHPDRAIVPAAGLGTRLHPITRAIPKEMLPLGRKPVLEHVLEELRAAGIHRILFVVSPAKAMVRDYFGDGSSWGVCCDYAVQAEMRGLGDAVLHGAEWSEGRPFVTAFGDCVIDAPRSRVDEPTPLQRLLATHAEHSAAVTVLTEAVPSERTRRYGIVGPVEPRQAGDVPFAISGIVEKPDPADAPSRHAVAARYVLDASIFDVLRRLQPRTAGELDLTAPINALLSDRAESSGPAWAVPLLPGEGRRDIGGWDTYMAANAAEAARDPDAGPAVRRAIRDVPESPAGAARR